MRENNHSERFLCDQDAIWAPALADILTENGIAFGVQKVLGAGLSAYVGPILERTEFYVPQADYEAAQALVQSFFSAKEDGVQYEMHAVDERIRPAEAADLERIAEIEIFNYRLNFYPIFRDDGFYFDALRVSTLAAAYEESINQFYVYDDGAVKGFIQAEDGEIKKLFVEPVLQGQGIGGKLLEFAMTRLDARFLWALEKNTRAIAFYERYGFRATGEKKPEEDTEEFLVRLAR